MRKLAISNIAWNPSSDEIIYSLMEKYSVQGLEVTPFRIFGSEKKNQLKNAKKFLKILSNYDIIPVAMQSLLFQKPDLRIFYEEIEREKTLDYLNEIIQLGSKCGINKYIFGSPKNRYIPEITKKSSYIIALDFFEKLGEIAHKNNSIICIEPNPKDYGTNFLNTTHEAAKFIAEIEHANLYLNLDIGAVTINQENLNDVFQNYFPLIGHIHISEPNLNPIDKGNCYHKMLVNLLQEYEYNMHVSIEMKNSDSDDSLQILEKTLSYVNQIFNE